MRLYGPLGDDLGPVNWATDHVHTSDLFAIKLFVMGGDPASLTAEQRARRVAPTMEVHQVTLEVLHRLVGGEVELSGLRFACDADVALWRAWTAQTERLSR